MKPETTARTDVESDAEGSLSNLSYPLCDLVAILKRAPASLPEELHTPLNGRRAQPLPVAVSMVEAQFVVGAATTLALAVFLARRIASRSACLDVPPVSSGWLAERRRMREDLVG